MAAERKIIEQLQEKILHLQQPRTVEEQQLPLGLGRLEESFSGHAFPRGVVHELISEKPQNAASTTGFLSVILGKLMKDDGRCVWVSTRRTVFPQGMKAFGIQPDRILFVDAPDNKEALWSIEEALKCNAVAAVVGEIRDLDFNQSRRLQLAVEQSRVSGFIHRFQPKSSGPVACATRWQITSLPGLLPPGMPGVGFPCWKIDLLKVRHGKPGMWTVGVMPDGFTYLNNPGVISTARKAG